MRGLMVAWCLAMVWCRAGVAVAQDADAAPSAHDVAIELAREHGLCVMSPLSEGELRAIPVEGPFTEPSAGLALLREAGLSVFHAGPWPLVAVTDLRPEGARRPAADIVAVASEFLAALPASAPDLQREVVRGTSPPSLPHFPLEGLGEAVLEAANRVVERSGNARLFPEGGRFGRLEWSGWTRLRTDRGALRTFERAGPREPPMAAGLRGSLASADLLWELWEHAGAEWTATDVPALPEGDISVEDALDVLRGMRGMPVRVHPSARLAEDSPLYIVGRPPSLGALVWALGMCGGVGCRAAGEDEPWAAEVFWAQRPDVRDEQYLCTLPGRGYVSPLHTEAGRAMLGASDYGHLLPVHALLTLDDLLASYPLLHAHWPRGELLKYYGVEEDKVTDAPQAVMWVRSISVAVTNESGGGALSYDLPLL